MRAEISPRHDTLTKTVMAIGACGVTLALLAPVAGCSGGGSQFEDYDGPAIAIAAGEKVYDDPAFDELCAVVANGFNMRPGQTSRPENDRSIIFYSADKATVPLKDDECSNLGMVWIAPGH